MPSTNPLVSAEATHGARRQLEHFVRAHPDVSLAVLTSSDGFEIAAYPKEHSTTPRIAAMSSSMQALAEAMIRESGFINSRNLIVESDNGLIVVLGLAIEKPRASLAVVAAGTAVMGHLLWSSRNCCTSLERCLQSPTGTTAAWKQISAL